MELVVGDLVGSAVSGLVQLVGGTGRVDVVAVEGTGDSAGSTHLAHFVLMLTRGLLVVQGDLDFRY